MIKKLLFLFLLLGSLTVFKANAQDASAKPIDVKFGKTVLNIHPDALLMMKTGDRTVELTPEVFDEIDQSWILTAEALKGQEATDAYGDKGELGVVLLSFHKKYEPEVLKIIQDYKRRKL